MVQEYRWWACSPATGARATAVSQFRVVPISHIFAAPSAGASRKAVREVIIPAALFAGLPVKLGGLEGMEQAYRELDGSAGQVGG